MTDPQPRRSLLETALGAITEVRTGEALVAMLLTAQIFLTLTAYYIIKPVREALILVSPEGAEYKSYATAAIALLMLVVVPIYSISANRLARNRLIIGSTGFFVICLIGFYVLGQSEVIRPWLGVPFYLWVGVFNMMVVAQFWAFANDIYDTEQGKRLFAMIGIGQSVGAALGSALTSLLLKPPTWWPLSQLSEYSLLLVSAACLALTGVITQFVHLRGSGAGSTVPTPKAAESQGAPQDKRGGFTLVAASKYLIMLAAFHLLFTFVNTNGEYVLSALVSAAAPAAGETADGLSRGAWIGAFYGTFYFWVNVVGVLLQIFAVSRIVKHAGLKIAFFALPIIVLGGASLIVLFPLLGVLRIAKTIENATDYSLNNTVRHMLWLPTTTEMKYKAKQAVDTFFVRMGDAGSGLLVFVGVTYLSMSVRGFAIANLVLAVVWILLAGMILRENTRLTNPESPAAEPPSM